MDDAPGFSKLSKPTDTLEDKLADFVLPKRVERFDSVLQRRTHNLTVVLDNINNTHNISAVIRSADAFGVQSVHQIGSEFGLSHGITLGAERWLDIHRYNTAEPAKVWLKQHDFAIVVLAPKHLAEARNGKAEQKSIPVYQLPFEQKLALVFGNEVSGVSKLFCQAADFFAHIPMYGFVESLNISVAAAITLFCATISQPVGKNRSAPLTNGEKQELKRNWLKQDVRGAELIIDALKQNW